MDIAKIANKAIRLSGNEFAENFRNKKSIICQTLGIGTKKTYNARRAMVTIGRKMHDGDRTYVKNNPNLVGVISQEQDKEPELTFGEVKADEGDNLFLLSVPVYEFTYIFAYRLVKE